MGDDKRKIVDSARVRRIASLFEVPRPYKSRLQRTNSLPPGCKNSFPSDERNSFNRSSLKSQGGKVYQIKEKIEKTYNINLTPKPVRKHRKHSKQPSHNVETVIEEINIKDMSIVIFNSDNETEFSCDKESDERSTVSTVSSTGTLAPDDPVTDSDGFTYVPYFSMFNSSVPYESGFRADYNPSSLLDHASNGLQEPNNDADTMGWWKKKSFVQVRNDTALERENSMTESELNESVPSIGRFKKNKNSLRSSCRRIGTMKTSKSVQELTRHFEGFRHAAEQGQTDQYRQSVIEEFDQEFTNMVNDGFGDDSNFSLEGLSLLDKDEMNSDTEERLSSQESGSPHMPVVFPSYNEDDMFGSEEDFENGHSYVEAYNADGKELIICQIQVDRRSVDLYQLQEFKVKSNLLLDNEKSIIILNDASSTIDSTSGEDSKRNTLYSTTSGDSHESEDIEAETEPEQFNYNAARRETFCDDKGVVRIERVAPISETEDTSNYVFMTNNYYDVIEQPRRECSDDEQLYENIQLEHEIMFAPPQQKKDTMHYIADEIKSTERKYVSDLKRVLEEYKTFLDEKCADKVDAVFANLEQIYMKQERFLQHLEYAGSDINAIVEAFVVNDDLFRLYPRYFRNTPKMNIVVKQLNSILKEKQDRIHDKLDLSAYLLTPLQRLGKYKLFLENIIKQQKKEDKPYCATEGALDVIKKYLSRGNDAVAIASILHSPLHTKDYGPFITREKFSMIKPRKMDYMVFLFESVIVFTTEDPNNMEQFFYHHSIKTIDLRIATFDRSSTIHLTDFTKTRKKNSSKYTYILDGKSSKIKMIWKQHIEDILWRQMEKMKEMTKKEYENVKPRTTKLSKPREQRSKSTGSSIFYVT